MPTTTRQLARLAGISEQTVRNWSEVYAELLTPSARGEAGARVFSDEDVQVFCTIADLRRDNVPPAEVLARLRRGDVYIDLTDHTTPQQTTPNAQNATEGHSDALWLPVALSSLQASHNALQRRIEAVERNQHTLLRAATLWGVLLGAIGALAVAGFYVWVLWLLGG